MSGRMYLGILGILYITYNAARQCQPRVGSRVGELIQAEVCGSALVGDGFQQVVHHTLKCGSIAHRMQQRQRMERGAGVVWLPGAMQQEHLR
jgi:hypothetical protein